MIKYLRIIFLTIFFFPYTISYGAVLSFNSSESVGSEEGNATGLVFNPDGTKMYVVGFNDKIFEYALNDYWSKQNNQIITFEKLMYDYGSPGKVFQLDEKSMEQYLEKLEMDSKNFVFSKGAGGLRQITKVKKISENQLLKNCYKKVA